LAFSLTVCIGTEFLALTVRAGSIGGDHCEWRDSLIYLDAESARPRRSSYGERTRIEAIDEVLAVERVKWMHDHNLQMDSNPHYEIVNGKPAKFTNTFVFKIQLAAKQRNSLSLLHVEFSTE